MLSRRYLFGLLGGAAVAPLLPAAKPLRAITLPEGIKVGPMLTTTSSAQPYFTGIYPARIPEQEIHIDQA